MDDVGIAINTKPLSSQVQIVCFSDFGFKLNFGQIYPYSQ